MSDPTPYSKVFRWLGPKQTIMSNKAANGIGTAKDVGQFKNIGIAVVMVNFTGTIKAQGSFENTENVDFSASAGPTNMWGYVGMWEYDGVTTVAGGTGLTGAATTSVKLYTMNSDELRSLNFILSGYGGGSVYVYAYPANNQ